MSLVDTIHIGFPKTATTWVQEKLLSSLPEVASLGKPYTVDINYREVLNDLRRQLAVRYVGDSRHSQAQVAYLLGFTDVSAFSHAFKRWTGVPPSQYAA